MKKLLSVSIIAIIVLCFALISFQFTSVHAEGELTTTISEEITTETTTLADLTQEEIDALIAEIGAEEIATQLWNVIETKAAWAIPILATFGITSIGALILGVFMLAKWLKKNFFGNATVNQTVTTNTTAQTQTLAEQKKTIAELIDVKAILKAIVPLIALTAKQNNLIITASKNDTLVASAPTISKEYSSITGDFAVIARQSSVGMDLLKQAETVAQTILKS